jgi:hypothetical protein
MRAYKSLIIIVLCILVLCNGCKSDQVKYESPSKTAIDTLTKQPAIDMTIFKQEGDAIVLPWKYMMNVKFEEKFNEKLGIEVSLPVFNDTLKVLDGKKVIIEGFFIPVDETGDDKIVIVSAYPYSQCFFCGKAGVESIVDVLSEQKFPHLKLDTKIKFKGHLKLNKENFDYLIYILENAELVR